MSLPGAKRPRSLDRGSSEQRTAGSPLHAAAKSPPAKSFAAHRQQKPSAGVSPPAGSKSPPQEFRRPQAAKENLIRFWGGSADPKNTSRKNSPDHFQRNRGGIFVQLPQKMAGPFFEVNASRPVSRVLSFKTAIYLDAPLPTRSSRLPGTAGPAYCPSTALLRIEFTAMGCSQPSGELLPHLSTFSGPKTGSLFLLHFS